jgi:hypothetical protein
MVRARLWAAGRGRATAALLLPALLGGAAPATSQVAPAPAEEAAEARVEMLGVGAHLLDERSLALLGELGVRHVRTTLYWHQWHRPAYRAEFAAWIGAAVARGFEPLVVVHGQPRGDYDTRERVYREFAEFVAARAAQFPEVRAWQLWNEMDVAFTDVFGASRDHVSLRQRGRNYARMLQLAYPAIKRANPRAVVVTGGIASGIGDGFLQGIYEGAGPFDVLAIHSYGFPLLFAFRDRGLEARAIMDAHGDTRPLWNTEFGMQSAVVPAGWPAGRADIDDYHLGAWRDAATTNEQRAIYERIYGHVLMQDGDVSYDLVRRDGSRRPAFVWLRGWMGGG